MGLFKWICSHFPSHKWCGCHEEMPSASKYQFRVKARIEDTHKNLFQVREKEACQHCGNERINVVIEDTCTYDPKQDIHERKVGVDEQDMVNYGFLELDTFARLLAEMRLSHSLNVD